MKFLRFFKNFHGIYIGAIVLISIFCIPGMGFQFKRNYAIGNPIHFCIALAVCLGLCFIFIKIKQNKAALWSKLHSENFFWIFFLCGAIILLLLQIFVINGAWFIVGWDTRDVIFPDMQMNSDYMSMYPNQLFLAGLFRRIYFYTSSIFGFSFEQYYHLLVLFSGFAVWCSIFMIVLTSKQLTNNFCAMCTFLVSAFFLGLSPWIMVPYSDNFAMFCTCLILLLYVQPKIPTLKWFLIFWIAIVGYAIKPTVLISLAAILFIEFSLMIINIYRKRKNSAIDCTGYSAFQKESLIEKILLKIFKSKFYLNRDSSKRIYDLKFFSLSKSKATLIFLSIVLAVCGICLGKICIDKVSNYGVEINKDDSFSATHFLMMGINLENLGGWNNDDVNMSRSYPNIKERNQANIKEFLNRINIEGPFGVAWIYFNKTLTNYGDGSFAWEAETPWCIDNHGQNPVVWGIYGIDPWYQHNDNNNFYSYILQVLWFTVLIGCFFMLLCQRPSKYEIMICCSLLGISAFLMICEPDPRYMLLYVPYMLLFMPWGWRRFGGVLCKKKTS